MRERLTPEETAAKYPADTVADVEIAAPGVNVKEEGIGVAHAVRLLDAYCEHSDEGLAAKCREVRDRYGVGFSGVYGNPYTVNVSFRRPRVDTGERQTCPRRTGEIGPWEHSGGMDTWVRIGDDRVCSFCGSVHPEDLVRIVREGCRLDQSDKSYKFYLRRSEVPNAGFGAIKFYKQHAGGDWPALYKRMMGGPDA